MKVNEKRIYYIYRMTHIPTGRSYVGKHICQLNKSPETDGYYGSGKVWKLIYSAHPKDEFKKEVLDEAVSLEEANEKEKEWIAKERNLRQGLCVNISAGGDGVSSEEATAMWKDPGYREKITKAVKERMKDPEVRAKYSKAFKEMWKDPEQRDKVSKASKEMWKDPEYRERQTQVSKEMWKDPEQREKFTKAFKEVWKDPGRRKTASKASKEMWKDPEHREKVSRAQKERMKDPEHREKVFNAIKERAKQRREKARIEFYSVPHSDEEIALFEKNEKRNERMRKYNARKKALAAANPDSKS